MGPSPIGDLRLCGTPLTIGWPPKSFGDPKKSGHPDVNADFRPDIHTAASDRYTQASIQYSRYAVRRGRVAQNN